VSRRRIGGRAALVVERRIETETGRFSLQRRTVLAVGSTGDGVGPFVVIETEAAGERLRVTAPSGTTEPDLVAAVDSGHRIAVVFVDQPVLPRFTSAPTPGVGEARLEVVVADGATTCLP